MFSWLSEGITVDGVHESGIQYPIDEGFAMYLHHQREVDGKSNFGWLKTIVFGLTQQVIGQALEYWILYVVLRPDQNLNLVSFPLYGKYTTQDDDIGSRH